MVAGKSWQLAVRNLSFTSGQRDSRHRPEVCRTVLDGLSRVTRWSRLGRCPSTGRDGKGSASVASTNDLKNGMVLDLDGQLWSVLWFQHHKPGKGNTVVRTKLKHVLSGKVVDRTFTADTKVDTANVDRREMQYLYHDGSGFVFMDTATYDQLSIRDETVGDAKNYLLEGQLATVALHEGQPLYLDLPASVELQVTYTEPGLQGDRSTGGTKPATVETGLQVQVPLFLTTGEKIKVDTRTGEYLGRVGS
jgi:elongation factor P